MSAVKDLTTMPDPEAVLEAIATALNISPEVLTHFAEHQGEIKTFLETQRGTLGLLAETKLWQLVGEGDAATVRWALQRLRPDIYGDKLTGGSTDEKTPRTIRIIEQD